MCLICVINAQQGVKDKATVLASDECCSAGSPGGSIMYFAIGSMCNPTCLALRSLTPQSSSPAVLNGFRLVFRGAGGMASVEEDDADSGQPSAVHGVLHKMSLRDIDLLDSIEGGYIRISCTVTLYDGNHIRACCYTMDPAKWKLPHGLPSERYLDIIAKGCRYHGVSSAWLQQLETTPCVPRKSHKDFSQFSMPGDAHPPVLSPADILPCNGLDGKPLRIVINGKVLEFKGAQNNFYNYFLTNDLGGKDFTLHFARGYYEPMYEFSDNVTSVKDMQLQHREWVEDQFACPPAALAGAWVMVGVAAEA